MRDTSAMTQQQQTPATREELVELYDNPLERLQLLAGDDAAIAAYLDEIDVESPRERAMLEELAREAALARPERLVAEEPLAELWRTIGWCGSPPRDQSRRFAAVAISLTLGVWIVLPPLVTLSLAS